MNNATVEQSRYFVPPEVSQENQIDLDLDLDDIVDRMKARRGQPLRVPGTMSMEHYLTTQQHTSFAQRLA